MNSDSNLLQREFWNGPAAGRWVREQEALDRAFAELTARLFDAAGIQPGEQVLDVGCGTGTTTLLAAERTGAHGRVTGVDLSGPMLGRARERCRSVPQIELFEADAATQAWTPHAQLLLSRFGVMFFAEPARAFANLRTALAPGGRLAFVCWRALAENEWVRTPLELVARQLEVKLPAPGEPGPFGFAEKSHVEDLLGKAGFRDLSLEPLDVPIVLGESLEEALDFTLEGGMAGRVLREASESIRLAVRDALRPRMAELEQPGGLFEMGGAIWIVRAWM